MKCVMIFVFLNMQGKVFLSTQKIDLIKLHVDEEKCQKT